MGYRVKLLNWSGNWKDIERQTRKEMVWNRKGKLRDDNDERLIVCIG